MRRGFFVAVVTVAGLVASAPPAGANHPPRFYSLMVPVQDHVPESSRVYAALGGVGNGTRLGDPVILATRNRGTYNPRSDWLPIDPRYPNLPEEVVTGGVGDCWWIGCFEGRPGRDPGVQGGRVKLVSRFSGKCMTISGVVGHAAPITQQTCRPLDPKQTWYFTVHDSPTQFAVAPVYWYQRDDLRCLGPSFRSAGRQLAVHRRLRSTETCPHWVVQYRMTGNWGRPFVNPF